MIKQKLKELREAGELLEDYENRLQRIDQTLDDKTCCHDIRIGFAVGLTQEDDPWLHKDLVARIKGRIIRQRNALMDQLEGDLQ